MHITLFADINETSAKNNEQIQNHKEAIESINNELQGSIWLTRFSNFLTYQKLTTQLNEIKQNIEKIKKHRKKSDKEQLKNLSKKQNTLQKQLELLKEFKKSPFAELVEPPFIEEMPTINNPLAIITGISYIKQLQSNQKRYSDKLDNLKLLINKLESKKELLTYLLKVENSPQIAHDLELVQKELGEFTSANDISKTTFMVYSKKVDEAIITTKNSITSQVKRAFNILVFVIVVIILSLMFKYIARKYIKDNVRFYMANKVINFINMNLIVLIVLFAYIDNVTYLVTVIGFASAGIAIAMKDMFMSVLGWIVIIFGGSFHVGDRIKVKKEGMPYVGDIIDISLLRMTILEDITYTSYVENRRTGRIIFIPNNYIFTELIANYTHSTMKTVWDGIDITITFDSNHKKAMYLIKNITKKFSKGYTDIARKQLNMLRHQYSLKNTNIEPRIYSFLEPHGLTISTWYQTNSYAALTLRSTLSAEIVDAINKEDDITIAFPTQTLHLNKTQTKVPIDINKDILY